MDINESEDLIQLEGFHTANIIKVIGVGGGGDNAVAHMYTVGNIASVNYLACNTDKKCLDDCPVPERLLLGDGLGVGGKPEKARQYAEEGIDKIVDSFGSDTRMVFITAGLGGGTGTGAAPVIAREAKARGLLTIGIVTLPFEFERERQIKRALIGLEEMQKNVDAMLVINNQRLIELYPDLGIVNAFRRSDDVLTIAVRSIVEIITMHGKWNLDFEDVKTVLQNGGMAIMSTGMAEGDDRVTRAISGALHSPLVNHNSFYKARRIVMLITSSSKEEEQLSMQEMSEISAFMKQFKKDVFAKFGIKIDDSVGKSVKITLLASGYNQDDKDDEDNTPEEDDWELMRRIGKWYGPENAPRNARKPVNKYIFDLADLDNEDIIALVDETPAYKRRRSTLDKIKEIKNNSL